MNKSCDKVQCESSDLNLLYFYFIFSLLFLLFFFCWCALFLLDCLSFSSLLSLCLQFFFWALNFWFSCELNMVTSCTNLIKVSRITWSMRTIRSHCLPHISLHLALCMLWSILNSCSQTMQRQSVSSCLVFSLFYNDSMWFLSLPPQFQFLRYGYCFSTHIQRSDSPSPLGFRRSFSNF